MNSFSVSNNEKGAFEFNSSNNFDNVNSINISDKMTFMTDANNDSQDDEESSRFRVSFDTRNYVNSTLLKPENVLVDNKSTFSDVYCKKCKFFEQIGSKNAFNKIKIKSSSMSDISNVLENFKTGKYAA